LIINGTGPRSGRADRHKDFLSDHGKETHRVERNASDKEFVFDVPIAARAEMNPYSGNDKSNCHSRCGNIDGSRSRSKDDGKRGKY
jgi:hypothetical protein